MENKPSEEELRSMLSECQTLYQISRQFNTTIKEVHKLKMEYGITRKNKIPRPTKQDLESMYHDEGMTQYQISREFGVTPQSVHMWFRNYNIQVTFSKIPPKEVLQRMYSEDGMTQEQIGSEFNVHHRTVSNWLCHYNIPTRGSKGTLAVPIPTKEVLQRMYTDEGMTQEQISREFNVGKSTVYFWLHDYKISTVGRMGSKVPMPHKDDLLNYIDEGLNQHQIAQKYKVCDATIFKWCEYYVIHGMVNNFRCTTPEYIEWRYAVFERDHYTCQKCGSTNNPIQAHHIVPFADHPEVAYEIENGITLCKECHKQTFGCEYEYIGQFAAITQPHLRNHEVIESMPWEAPLPPLSDKLFPDYPQEVIA